MGLISRRFKFLENLFPPGGAFPPQPGFFEESVSPVHQILNGTDRLDQWFTFSGGGAAGNPAVNSGASPGDKYWFCFSCDTFHNDPIARDLWIELVPTGANGTAIAHSERAVPTSVHLSVGRAFIIPPRTALRGQAIAIAGGQVMTLRFQYLELDLGEPAPPSP